MLSEKKPYELIQDLVAERATWSDDDVIAEIEQLPPLADEGDPIWEDQAYWRVAYRFVGLSDVAAQRRLRPAVRLLLERACNGDPGVGAAVRKSASGAAAIVLLRGGVITGHWLG